MLIGIKLFAIVYFLMGIVFLIKPEYLRNYTSYWKEGRRIYFAGFLVLLPLSIILLASASECRWPIFVYALGAIVLIKLIAIFALGPKRFTPMLDWWAVRSAFAFRIIGVVAATIGALLFYSV